MSAPAARPGSVKLTYFDNRGGPRQAHARVARTMADVPFVDERVPPISRAADIVRFVSPDRLDHIPKEIVEQKAPALTRHWERVLAEPRIRAHHAHFGL